MINEIVTEYLNLFPEDEPKLQRLLGQLATGEMLDDRNNFNGHIAGDAVIVSPDLKKILLIYHKRFANWQQPGGHWDPGEDGPWLTAEREAAEETGLSNLTRVNIGPDFRVPIHIVTGPVTPSPQKGEPAHWHHDFRYGFIAESEKLPPVDDEGVSGAKWAPIDKFRATGPGAHNFEISVERLNKLLSLKA
jgi:8-oxo-dGTP pyrophosphatase MutT (NUDIX family)